MGAFTDPAAMLTAWEAAAPLDPLVRGPVLVKRPTDPVDALDLSLGEVARRAVQEHLDTFGDVVHVTVTCTVCGQVLELELSLTDIAGADSGADGDLDRQWSEVDDGNLLVRSPTTRDLLAVGMGHGGTDPGGWGLGFLDPGGSDPGGAASGGLELGGVESGGMELGAAAVLLERCVRDREGNRVPVDSLTVDERAAVDADLERRNAAAAVVLRTGCAYCGADVAAALDPGVLLWQQVQAAAPALLTEIAALAGAFGWTEDAVLALSPARRRAYLDLVAT